MKPCLIPAGVVCLLLCPILLAQDSKCNHYLVSLYQLEHKPSREARHLFDKGTADMKRADYKAGLKSLAQALQIDPDFWEAQNNVGYAYLKLAENAKAEEAFERAVKIDPENPSGYTNLGVSALLLNDYQLAEEAAKRALRFGSQSAEAKALLGLVQVAEGHYSSAAHKLLEEASTSVPAAQKMVNDWSFAEKARAKLIIVGATQP